MKPDIRAECEVTCPICDGATWYEIPVRYSPCIYVCADCHSVI